MLPRDIDGAEYERDPRVGPAALRALGIQTAFTHMEWFERPDGSVAVSEVGARPPGAQISSMIGFGHDIDFYGCGPSWCCSTFTPAERVYAVGTAYLRGQGRGRVRAVHGVDEVQPELGHLVVDAGCPPGQPAASSYEGEGFVTVRHPEDARSSGRPSTASQPAFGSSWWKTSEERRMNVVMVSPGFPLEMAYFTRALAQTGATVIGVGDQPVVRPAARGPRRAGPLRARLAGRRRCGAGRTAGLSRHARSTRSSACGSRTWCWPPASGRCSGCPA